jgi:hypothetical protein
MELLKQVMVGMLVVLVAMTMRTHHYQSLKKMTGRYLSTVIVVEVAVLPKL